MFKGVGQWNKMFERYCELKEKESDPNRYKNNRGNKLANELQEMNKLKKKLPKLEAELASDINEWENEHAEAFLVHVSWWISSLCSTIYIQGVEFIHFIEDRWGEIQDCNKQVRNERQRRKKEQLAVEMVCYSFRFSFYTFSYRFTEQKHRLNEHFVDPARTWRNDQELRPR